MTLTGRQWIMVVRARRYADRIYTEGLSSLTPREAWDARVCIDGTLHLVAVEGLGLDAETLQPMLFAGQLLGVIQAAPARSAAA